MTTIEKIIALPFRKEGETFREFFLRVRREEDGESANDELASELEEHISVIDRMMEFGDRYRQHHGVLDDSTDLLRRDRKARSNHLTQWSE